MELLRLYGNYNTILPRLQHLLELPQRAEASDRRSRRPKQLQHRLTPDQRAELIARSKAGEKAHQLARAHNIHRFTVARLLTDAGVHRPRCLTAEQVQEAIALYAHGWSYERIGQHFGKNHGTIWLALKRAGVRLRDTSDSGSS